MAQLPWSIKSYVEISGVPAVPRANREDGRRVLQPHDLLRVRLRILLALHEGDIR